MSTKTEIICYTDLKGSTALTAELGHAGFVPFQQDHLRVGQLLAERCGGKYVKNVGDAHLVRFEHVEHALAFALRIQEYCAEQKCLSGLNVPVRVSLFQGPVTPIGDDVFGSGVNQGARLQSNTEPSMVTLNEGLLKSIEALYGKEAAGGLCPFAYKRPFKGITTPKKHKIFTFDYSTWKQTYPAYSLAALVKQHLASSNVELSNLKTEDLATPGLVIWPVVPRNLVTAIHRCQIEVIRLLALIGWRVTVLIADCGGENEYHGDYVRRFQQSLEKHLNARQLSNIAIRQMSELYDPMHKEYSQVQEIFRHIMSTLTMQRVMELNNKEYSDEVIEQITRKSTLAYMRPTLTMAAVLHLTQGCASKCVVIAGKDEEGQWKLTYSIRNGLTALGACLIPIVKMDPKHQVQMDKSFPIWFGIEEASRHCCDGGNVADWLYDLLARLPAFPEHDVKICGAENVQPGKWSESCGRNESTAKALIEHVWSILEPA